MEAAVAAQSMFRAMKADSDGYPTTGSSSRTLGVRIDGLSRDILVALDRTVSPGTGGMSVALSVAGPRRVVQPDEPSKLRVAELGHRTLRSESSLRRSIGSVRISSRSSCTFGVR